uniref:Ubiquitin carboxyl-terminal hydrolase n=1 Tax=Odontella aurita TaxID=265563 RepID=A0A7S4J8P6_9STRA
MEDSNNDDDDEGVKPAMTVVTDRAVTERALFLQREESNMSAAPSVAVTDEESATGAEVETPTREDRDDDDKTSSARGAKKGSSKAGNKGGIMSFFAASTKGSSSQVKSKKTKGSPPAGGANRATTKTTSPKKAETTPRTPEKAERSKKKDTWGASLSQRAKDPEEEGATVDDDVMDVDAVEEETPADDDVPDAEAEDVEVEMEVRTPTKKRRPRSDTIADGPLDEMEREARALSPKRASSDKKRRRIGVSRIQNRAEQPQQQRRQQGSPSSPPSTTSQYFSLGSAAKVPASSAAGSSADAALGPPSKSPTARRLATTPVSKTKRKSSPVKQTASASASAPPLNPYNKIAPKKSSEDSKPRNRSDDNVAVGLRNLGNTCYLNASVQMLLGLPGFVEELDRTRSRIAEAAVAAKGGQDGEEKKEEEKSVVPLTEALLEVARSLRILPDTAPSDDDDQQKKVADPTVLKRAIDALTSKFTGYEQRDAHEFVSDLIDALHDELSAAENAIGGDDEVKNVLPTDEYFRLNVKVCLTCDSCGYTRSKEELYRHLSLDVGDEHATNWTVEAGLRMFFRPERREIKCEKCEDGTSATQKMEILSRPKALLLHLKRFVLTQNFVSPPPSTKSVAAKKDADAEVDKDKDGGSKENKEADEAAGEKEPETAAPPPVMEMTFRKNKARVSLHETVSTDDVSASAPSASRGTAKAAASRRYGLRGVVHHIGGTASSGHYTADSVRTDGAGLLVAGGEGERRRWVDFDDRVTTPTTREKVLGNERNQRNAYMMLYELGC